MLCPAARRQRRPEGQLVRDRDLKHQQRSDLSDTAGAAKAGLRTATVARPDEFGPGSGPSTPKVAADIIAKDLNDLADKLGA